MRYLKLFLETQSTEQDWTQTSEGLYKKYTFSNFTEAMQFIFDASKLIEIENHHPKWTNEYNTVEIWLKTHDENKITEKDFNLATKLDSIVDSPNKTGLTKKEKQVLSLLKKGKSYQEIADELGMKFFTVNFHIKNLYKKFGVNSISQLLTKKLFD